MPMLVSIQKKVIASPNAARSPCRCSCQGLKRFKVSTKAIDLIIYFT